jgi:hypothetical protein
VDKVKAAVSILKRNQAQVSTALFSTGKHDNVSDGLHHAHIRHVVQRIACQTLALTTAGAFYA